MPDYIQDPNNSKKQVPGAKPDNYYDNIINQKGIAVRTGHHCTMPVMEKFGVPATARASFYIYNTKYEIDCLVDTLENALRYFKNGII